VTEPVPQFFVVGMLECLVSRAGSQKVCAEQLGVTPGYLNDVLHGRRDVSAQLADRLGLERVVLFRVKEGAD